MRQLDWKKRAALVAPLVVPLHEAIHARAPVPHLVNHSGDTLLFSTAHYAVRDHAAARRGLDQWLGESGDGRCELLEGTTVHASFELGPEALLGESLQLAVSTGNQRNETYPAGGVRWARSTAQTWSDKLSDMVRKRNAWGLAKAKAHLSELVERSAGHAQVIERRGRPVAVVVDAARLAELERSAEAASSRRRMQAFLEVCASVRDRGGADLDVGKRETRKSPFSRR